MIFDPLGYNDNILKKVTTAYWVFMSDIRGGGGGGKSKWTWKTRLLTASWWFRLRFHFLSAKKLENITISQVDDASTW